MNIHDRAFERSITSERAAALKGIKPKTHGLPVGMITTYVLARDNMPVEDQKRVELMAQTHPEVQAEIEFITRDAEVLRNQTTTFSDV